NQANQNPDPGQAAAQTTQPNVLASNGTLQQGHGTSRHDATINYEVDRTISHVKNPLGTLRRLSVAVVVNDRYNQDGEPEALSEAELGKLTDLVKQAMGYSAERGDTLSVVNGRCNNDEPTVPVWE